MQTTFYKLDQLVPMVGAKSNTHVKYRTYHCALTGKITHRVTSSRDYTQFEDKGETLSASASLQGGGYYLELKYNVDSI